jgi:glycosyltransferase involved in cell wall biosynthesis
MTPSKPSAHPPRVVILNNEIFPYRVQLFRSLEISSAIRLLVLYSVAYDPDRKWRINMSILNYPHRILPGFPIRLPKRDYSEKRTIYFNPTLFLELVRFHPDVLIGYEYSLPAMTALVYARLFHRPYILWTDCTPHTERHLTRGQHWTRSIIIPRARICIGTNHMACLQLIAAGAESARVLEAPQVHEVRQFAAKAAAAGRKLRTSVPRLLYVGSLTERKGVDLLLKAFMLVSDQHPTARLRIVGDGVLRPQLERIVAHSRINGKVDFAGFVNYEKIHEEYSQADVFILPTLEDAFGVVIVEALSSGVPVVCSPFAGAADYIQDGVNGFIVNPTEIPALAERISRLLSDSTLREEFSAQGRESSLLFDAPSVAEVFLLGIRKALEGW